MPYILFTLIGVLSGGDAGVTDVVTSIDFTPMLQKMLDLITSDFAKYALVAGGAALTVWGAPKALMMAKKFFTALSR
ncbi:MAG: hypothetical protein OSJ71_17915 [Acetatifactor sp.]|nr:hypothetical protein [Acetatifactor sp.]